MKMKYYAIMQISTNQLKINFDGKVYKTNSLSDAIDRRDELRKWVNDYVVVQIVEFHSV